MSRRGSLERVGSEVVSVMENVDRCWSTLKAPISRSDYTVAFVALPPTFANMPTENVSEPSPHRMNRLAAQEDPAAELDQGEIWWRDHQKWLEEQGYMLGPRWRPGWIPSWHSTKKFWFNCEDAQVPTVSSRLYLAFFNIYS